MTHRPTPTIRPADVDDLEALVALEERSFAGDRINRRQFRYLLTKAKAVVLVAEVDGRILGDVVVLFSRGTSLARLYSIAVAEEARGHGVGRELVRAAEEATWSRHRAYLRLEIRKDNTASIALFEGMGYRRIGEWLDYYEDHMDAWRFEKTLAPALVPNRREIPFYEQTLDFTCGPATLMMAMKALDPDLALNRKLELRLWREATTIFMTSGHGGCSPFGLALSAVRRGFRAEVYLSNQGVLFIDSVRSKEKKEVMRLVQEEMEEEVAAEGIRVHYEGLPMEQLKAQFEAGAIPLMLISSWLIYKEKFPHWVVVTGFDEHFIYAHDSFVDYAEGERPVDSIHMPIPVDQFERMLAYGKSRLRAAVMIWPHNEPTANGG